MTKTSVWAAFSVWIVVLPTLACNETPPAVYDYADPDLYAGDGDIDLPPGDLETDGDGDIEPDNEENEAESTEDADSDVDEGPVYACLRRVATGGFGDNLNKHASAMAVFKDRLFVGTFNGDGGSEIQGEPEYSFGGEIWAYDGETWTKIIERGFGDFDNIAVTTLVAVGGEKLYAGTLNVQTGAQLWVSENGETWDFVGKDGLGDPANTAVRAMADFNGQLIVGTENTQSGAQLIKLRQFILSAIVRDGIDSQANTRIGAMTMLRGKLLIGVSGVTGASIYQYDGDAVTRLTGQGRSFDFPFGHTGVASMTVHNERYLYAGTENLVNGFGVFRSRDLSRYLQLESDGFGDRAQAYGWSLASFQGSLFVGAFNQGSLLNPLESGGAIFKSDDGESFTKLVGDEGPWAGPGIDNDRNYGFPSMAVYRDKLYVGTGQCYSCGGREGLEVWEIDDADCVGGFAR
ncbi:MAG: hypothetical protein C4523_16915 [Myxococcales bacterium]|nr:MAG: hypothetical protein C4523_16915 [Myxococcales bacterium]